MDLTVVSLSRQCQRVPEAGSERRQDPTPTHQSCVRKEEPKECAQHRAAPEEVGVVQQAIQGLGAAAADESSTAEGLPTATRSFTRRWPRLEERWWKHQRRRHHRRRVGHVKASRVRSLD